MHLSLVIGKLLISLGSDIFPWFFMFFVVLCWHFCIWSSRYLLKSYWFLFLHEVLFIDIGIAEVSQLLLGRSAPLFLLLLVAELSSYVFSCYNSTSCSVTTQQLTNFTQESETLTFFSRRWWYSSSFDFHLSASHGPLFWRVPRSSDLLFAAALWSLYKDLPVD